MDELMTALWDHLRPHPYNDFHAHTTMRILGKLGGRNRKFMTGAVPLTYREFADDPSSKHWRGRLWGVSIWLFCGRHGLLCRRRGSMGRLLWGSSLARSYSL